jgi:starch synthase
MFRTLAGQFPDRMRAVLEFRAELAPIIYGGSDIFLMPSLFEPCGLSQMMAMRYACLPVVRATGGLVDTVWDGVTGFSFGPHTADAFYRAVARATNVFNIDEARWRHMQLTAMQQDFSWKRSAAQYVALYEEALSA